MSQSPVEEEEEEERLGRSRTTRRLPNRTLTSETVALTAALRAILPQVGPRGISPATSYTPATFAESPRTQRGGVPWSPDVPLRADEYGRGGFQRSHDSERAPSPSRERYRRETYQPGAHLPTRPSSPLGTNRYRSSSPIGRLHSRAASPTGSHLLFGAPSLVGSRAGSRAPSPGPSVSRRRSSYAGPTTGGGAEELRLPVPPADEHARLHAVERTARWLQAVERDPPLPNEGVPGGVPPRYRFPPNNAPSNLTLTANQGGTTGLGRSASVAPASFRRSIGPPLGPTIPAGPHYAAGARAVGFVPHIDEARTSEWLRVARAREERGAICRGLVLPPLPSLSTYEDTSLPLGPTRLPGVSTPHPIRRGRFDSAIPNPLQLTPSRTAPPALSVFEGPADPNVHVRPIRIPPPKPNRRDTTSV